MTLLVPIDPSTAKSVTSSTSVVVVVFVVVFAAKQHNRKGCPRLRLP